MTLSNDERPRRGRGLLGTSTKAGAKVCGLVTLLGGFAILSMGACESGGVGDPCIPEDEYRASFAGFSLSQANIESRSFQCKTRICLVNHFQGRVSCPQGQEAPTVCNDGGDARCDDGESCVDAGAIITDCDPTRCNEEDADPGNCNEADGSNPACGGRTCDEDGKYCHCNTGECPENFFCDSDDNLCKTRVCSIGDAEEDEEHCYVPGTNIPVTVEVCAQCDPQSGRHAEDAVYCSCRCDPPSSGASDADENFNFCECPEGFTCTEVRDNLGLGDAQLAGKYCVKEGTAFNENIDCGQVQGHFDSDICEGIAPSASN